jgi:cytosine/adenosine deaminase-related metal-dependent hydrolase
VWFAHAVYINQAEVQVFAKHGCGVAHCPTSNMRLASGIAPIKEFRAAGVNVGLGVDGSASNDGSSLLGEVRSAMLVARVKEGITGFSASPPASPTGRGAGGEGRKLMTAREALYLGTRGGAAVLGRTDIGSLEAGKCADFFAVNLNRIEYAGALHDPVAAVVFCQPVRVDYTVAGGRFVVKAGQLVTVDEGKLVQKHNQAARAGRVMLYECNRHFDSSSSAGSDHHRPGGLGHQRGRQSSQLILLAASC